eukprot:Skav221057  [mRNA]  locus=scaffold4018:958:1551:- [translate_table: standard]
MKHCSTASYLYDYEPIFASFSGQAYQVELVVSMRGGVKTKKGDTVKDAKLQRMALAKTQFTKLTQSINGEIVQQSDALKQLDVVISQFMAVAENDPSRAIETQVSKVGMDALTKITNVLDDAKTNGDYKIAKISTFLFQMENIEKVKDTYEHVLSAGSMAMTFAMRKLAVEQSALPLLKAIVSKVAYHKENTANMDL